MFNNKAGINLVELTFDAVLDSFRVGEITQPNGSIKHGRHPVLSSEKCGVYVHRAEEYDPRRSVQPLNGDFKIFTYQQSDINKGDEITVTQYGRSYTMIAGEPIRYETHQEVVCKERGQA